MKRVIFPLLLLAVLAACAPATTPGTTETPAPVEVTQPPQLTGTVWRLASLQEAGGAQVDLLDQVYTLHFGDDGSLGATMDCNTGGGTYEVDGNSLTFGPVVSTLMYCSEDSVASNYGVSLARVERYSFAGDELILSAEDGTSMRFTAQPDEG